MATYLRQATPWIAATAVIDIVASVLTVHPIGIAIACGMAACLPYCLWLFFFRTDNFLEPFIGTLGFLLLMIILGQTFGHYRAGTHKAVIPTAATSRPMPAPPHSR